MRCEAKGWLSNSHRPHQQPKKKGEERIHESWPTHSDQRCSRDLLAGCCFIRPGVSDCAVDIRRLPVTLFQRVADRDKIDQKCRCRHFGADELENEDERHGYEFT
jgi:hypothetical protein